MGVLLVRTVILYAVTVFALRIMGKRQLGELQPSEFVVTLLVSNLATLTIDDSSVPLLGSIMPIFMLVACEVLSSFLVIKNVKLRKIISGNPCIVIRDGVIDQQVMKELRWSLDDLMAQLRMGSVFDVGDVSFAVVETSGKLSVFKKFEAQEATAGMLKLPLENECDSPPMTVISDGKYVPGSLRFCRIGQDWVDGLLREKNLKPEDIFLMTLNRRAQYYISVKEKKGGASK